MLSLPEAVRTTSEWERPETVQRFRELVLSGKYSYAQIAAQLNADGIVVTRNACIGKAGRLKISIPPGLKSKAEKKKPRKPVSAIRIVARKQSLEEMFSTTGLRDLRPDQSPFAKTIFELLDDTSQCRFPVDAPEGSDCKDQHFCACDAADGFPYCIRHCQIAYAPSKVRA